MPRKQKDYPLKIIDHVYSQIPAFTDIFTEESFYMTAVAVVMSTIAIVFVLSRFITIKPVD